MTLDPLGKITRLSISALVLFLENLIGIPRPAKRLLVFVFDCVLLLQTIWIAYSIRMGVWEFWNDAILTFTAGSFLIMAPTFFLTGMYKAIFRYAGLGMLITIIKAFVVYTAGVMVVYSFWGFDGVPRTLGLLQPVLFFVAIAASRVVFRALVQDLMGRRTYGGALQRTLIYGAGRSGQQLANSCRNEPSIQLLGFIDDDVRLRGQRLDGSPVYHSADLDKLIRTHRPDDVILAIPSAGLRRRQEILRELAEHPVRVRLLPPFRGMLRGDVSFSDLRPIEIDDLLGREPVAPNHLLLSRTTAGKRIMVTGAGGSIGSEICRQIVALGASQLVLVDVSEYALYQIEAELRALLAQTPGSQRLQLTPCLANVAEAAEVMRLFTRWPVDVAYHAAAYKHVPLVESNVLAGVKNNVQGTLNMVRAADRYGLSDFILISSDKAVRPTNVMGATKRVAEQITLMQSANSSGTRFSMVRFGNVLGSSGSVVPLFRRQIELGGPITLTHSEVTRYFMSIPEAASLVIQAGGMAAGGEVFLLDMGQPIKIGDLARTMVRLSGLTVCDAACPDGDIQIHEIGLRPGEKMYEELLIEKNALPTRHPRIMKAVEGHAQSTAALDMIEQLCSSEDEGLALHLLSRLVPEFVHSREHVARQAAAGR